MTLISTLARGAVVLPAGRIIITGVVNVLAHLISTFRNILQKRGKLLNKIIKIENY